MIKFEEAYQIVLERAIQTETEKIYFTNALGRVLAEDVISDIEMPPFDKSAMDGYACRKQDINSKLEIIEIIPAGKTPEKEIGPNQCAKIMTGAPIPKGADFVVKVESSEEIDGKYVNVVKEVGKDNISYQGEDVKLGQTVLKKGIKIRPEHIAVFASVGYTNVLVGKQPKVGIISTGDELVEPENKPSVSQIRNSNAYQLIAQVLAAGALPNYIGIADDTPEDTFDKLSKAIAENDVVLLTGGVSMGSYDFVPDVMKKVGVEILFDSIAVKPGKPTTFGVVGKKYCYGLPGNPVSSFMQFELLVKPLINKMMHSNEVLTQIKLPVGEDFKRKTTERKAFHPIIIRDGKVYSVDYHGSAHVHALSSADGFISFEIGEELIKKGDLVDVRQI